MIIGVVLAVALSSCSRAPVVTAAPAVESDSAVARASDTETLVETTIPAPAAPVSPLESVDVTEVQIVEAPVSLPPAPLEEPAVASDASASVAAIPLPEGVDIDSVPFGERQAIAMLEEIAGTEIGTGFLDEDQLASWRRWWDFNKEPYLQLKRKIHGGGITTGSDEFFLGKEERLVGGAGGGQAGGAPSTPGPAGPSAPSPGTPGAPAGSPRSAPRAPLTGMGGSPGPSYTPAVAAPVGRGPFHPAAGVDGADSELVACLANDGDCDLAQYLGHLCRGCSADERGQLAERCSEIVISGCRRYPDERPRDMHFRFWGDNGFELARFDRLSTFAADVDTASYALARTYLERNHLPEKTQVRTEEFVNYFAPDLSPPTEDTFAISTELAPSLFGGSEDRWMLRVGIRAREISKEERKPLVLVFVVDTSGSMKEDGRLELVKHAMRLLVGELDARDKIGLVAFSTDARLILPVTPAAQRGLIESAIHPLRPQGSTNAEAGLHMGYELALAALDREAVNRVILLSDGVANTGQTDQDRISESVRSHREKGIYLNTVGVGMNNHNDVLLEQLADRGDGICDYVDDADSARRALVERFTGAFEPVASDVKIQVEFDPAQVYRWRQLGYENRAVADADFRNDAVDAGEIGAGHQVVALYEIERATGAASEAPLATVRLRWKAPKAPGQDPREIEVSERESKLAASQALGSFASASYGYRRSVLAAQFAEFLRRSSHTEHDSYTELLIATKSLTREKPDAETNELASLVGRCGTLIQDAYDARFARKNPLVRSIAEMRRLQIHRAELESLQLDAASNLLDEIERQTDDLEKQIRDLVRDAVH